MRTILKNSCLLIAALILFVSSLAYSQEPDDHAYIEKIECLDDMSRGVITFRQKGRIYGSLLGYVDYDLTFKPIWNKKGNNGYTAWGVESNAKRDGKIEAVYVDKEINDHAMRMINDSIFRGVEYNIQDPGELRKMVEAHENKHVEDIKSYPWIVLNLDFSISEGSEPIKIAEEKRLELLYVMEARAVSAEINAYKKILNKRRVKNAQKYAKEIVYASYGKAKIADTEMTYIEAHEKYAKSNLLKMAKEYREELLKGLSNMVNNRVVRKEEVYRARSAARVIMHAASDSGRPVCRPCMWGDSIGKCQFWWCDNSGEYHSKYKRKPGDYVPNNYAEPFKR